MKNFTLIFSIFLTNIIAAQFCSNFGWNYNVDDSPRQIISEDFNKDGYKDLALPNQGSNMISVLLGTGTGSFSTYPANYTVGLAPCSVVAADFNDDGNLDLASANNFHSNVSVLLGNGTGSFTSIIQTFTVGYSPVHIISSDLNGDSKTDLAVATAGQNSISILFGTGTGSFTPAINVLAGTNFTAGGGPTAIICLDFNGDSNMDLAVCNQTSQDVNILSGDGIGNFSITASYTVGGTPNWLCTNDFNEDGKADLAIATYQGNKIAVLLGDGTGHFSAAPDVPRHIPSCLTTADFDQDGHIDLVSANYSDWVPLMVFKGRGDGTFIEKDTLYVNTAMGVVAEDFNGDSLVDLAVASYDNDGSASIFLGCRLITGLNEQSGEQNPSIYPNPNNGSFSVRVDAEKYRLCLTDIAGSVFYEKSVGSKSEGDLHINDLPRGIYFLSLRIQGNKSLVKKLIVE